MNSENITIWYWLIPLIVGIFATLLGYLWGKSEGQKGASLTETKLLRDQNAKLKADLEVCHKKLTSPSSVDVSAHGDLAPLAGPISFDAKAAQAIFGKTILEDDLKIVEGIGPKIEIMFKAAGIDTWKALSETSVAGCQDILKKGGDRYKIHDPASWPMQAKMCYEGKWSELYRWQEEHDHGKL